MTKEYSFIKPDYTLRNNLMAFGWECDLGWYPLLTELFDKMEEVVKKSPEIYKDFQVQQVKEKWGELRIYCSWYRSEIEALIDECNDKCAVTCEICGKEGSMKERYHWYKTLCQECYDKWNL